MSNSNSIAKDLCEVFDLEFRRLGPDGDPCYSFKDSTIPNPGLSIDGIGELRLPFSPEDGQALMNLYNVPPGQPCEIGPWMVSFKNPGWWAHANTTLLKRICKETNLVPPNNEKVAFKFKKLVLHGPNPNGRSKDWDSDGTGHCTEARLQTYRGGKTFLHVEVVLPSRFEGEALSVEDESMNDIEVECGSYSRFSTSIQAWYTDGKCCVEPLTSGYRLSLEYVVEIDDLLSIRHLLFSPVQWIQIVEKMCEIFTRWKVGLYRHVPSPPVVVVAKTETPDTWGFLNMITCAHHPDSFLLINVQVQLLIRGMGAETVEECVERTARTGGSVCCSREDTRFEHVPSMGRVRSRRIIMDFQCKQEEKFYGGSIQIEEGCLAPGFFDEPDDKPFEVVNTGLSSPEEWNLEQRFHKRAHVLLQRKDEDYIAMAAKGFDWAISELQRLKQTGDHQALLAELRERNRRAVQLSRSPSDISAPAKKLLDCASNWKDLNLWWKVLPLCDFSGDPIGFADGVDDVIKSCGIQFADVQFRLEELVDCLPDPIQRLEVVNALHDQVDAGPEPWLIKLAEKHLVHCHHLQEKDIYAIYSTIIRYGFDELERPLVLLVSSGDLTFDFLVAFLKNGLIDLRREFIGDYPHGLHSSYLTIVHACFMAAAKVPGNTPEVLCGSGSQRPSSGGQPRPCPPCITAVDHICTLVKLCLSEEEVRPLLNSVLETALPSEEGDPDELWMMLGDFFIPLILRIMEMLSGVSQTVASPPFNAFFHHLIRISLKRLFDPEEYVPLFTVHTLDPGEYHLSQQIHAHHDVARLVRLGTVAHSHHERMFELRRKAKAVGLDDWTRRQTAVRLVLQYIGDLDALLAIMGRVMLDKAHRVL